MTCQGTFTGRDGNCSYCGSISPETFFDAIEQGCELGPTDKSYKVYVDLIEENPDEMKVVSAITHDPTSGGFGGSDWVPADPEVLRRSGWGGGNSTYKWMLLRPKGPTRNAKFYFEHLDRDGQDRFMDLLNGGLINIGYPGYFYSRPFFVGYRGE